MLRPDRDPLGRLRRTLRHQAGPAAEPGRANRSPAPVANTSIELQVAALLRGWGVGYHAQHRLLPGVTVDFYVPRAHLVIECQGTWYHADPTVYRRAELNHAQRRKRAHDAALQRFAARSGLVLLELWEEDLRRRPEWCARRLRAALGLAAGEDPMSERVCRVATPAGIVLAVHHGDLTSEPVDAIVNAANSHLAHGGGVAGAIVRRGGADIQRESDAWVRQHGPVPTGQVALTGAGSLPCRAVIHAVGPVWHGGQQGEPEALRSAAAAALELADTEGHRSVALPAISSGIFGFPKPLCAEILTRAAWDFATACPDSSLREIRFTNFDQLTVDVFAAEFRRRFGDAVVTGEDAG